MSRPRVLVVAKHHIDDPPSGGVLRLRATVGALSEAFDVRVIAYRERGRPRPMSARAALGLALLRGDAYQVARWDTRRLRAALERELDRFRPDALHVAAPALGRLGVGRSMRAVLDMMDVESAFAGEMARVAHGPRRALLEREARKFAELEAGFCRDYDLVIVSSAREADRARCEAEIVPNGVDAADEPGWERAVAGRIAFVGLMSWWPNVDGAEWLVRDVLPLLPPRASIEIVGRDPGRRVLALSGPRVHVTGEVPSVGDHIAQASVVVVPLRMRAGTRLKVLEAMALGRPVVATPEGADGLEYLAGQGLVIADGADAFARAVTDLLDDGERARRLGRGGRELVLREHGWDAAGERLRSLYRDRLGLGG